MIYVLQKCGKLTKKEKRYIEYIKKVDSSVARTQFCILPSSQRAVHLQYLMVKTVFTQDVLKIHVYNQAARKIGKL